MIIRIFRARVRPGKQEEFERFMNEKVIPMVGKHKDIAEYAGRPYGSSSNEFTYVSVWKNLSDLRVFAGEGLGGIIDTTRRIALLEETFLHHFELFHKGRCNK